MEPVNPVDPVDLEKPLEHSDETMDLNEGITDKNKDTASTTGDTPPPVTQVEEDPGLTNEQALSIEDATTNDWATQLERENKRRKALGHLEG